MTSIAAPADARDPNHVGRGASAAQDAPPRKDGPAPERIVVGFGFWIFLLSDIIMFSAFFATYAVLSGQTDGGPGAAQLFSLRSAVAETVLLLLSTLACGIAAISAGARRTRLFQLAMVATLVFGVAFLALELNEFIGLVARGAGPGRSAFLSAFFALVACHGLHVGVGVLWLLTMMAQVFAKGFRDDILRRILCFTLFWHALDIIWVALFTVVYLMGVSR